eukprot:5033116-Amphidinium_carterae.1
MFPVGWNALCVRSALARTMTHETNEAYKKQLCANLTLSFVPKLGTTQEAEDASEMLVIHSDSLIRVLSSDAPGARMMQHYAKGASTAVHGEGLEQKPTN